MPHSEAHKQFQESKRIGYEVWHEGTGYDLDAFAGMMQAERDAEATEIRAMDDPDWRDLEVLGALGSRESIEHLRHLLATHSSIETRAHALGVLIDGGHTPGAVPDVQLSHVLDAIIDDDGLTPALFIAQDHAGPISKLALLRGAQSRPAIALHFASALLDLAGVSEDLAAFDPKFRPTLLRLLPDNAAADRTAAFNEVCQVLAIDPASIPSAGSGKDWAWAERTWKRREEP